MKVFLKSLFFALVIIMGSASDSFAQHPFDACNPTACNLTITVDYEPACATASGCPSSFTFTVPAGACPFNIITPCGCPIVGVTVTDGTFTYVAGDPGLGYPGWNPFIGVKLCGGSHDIHIGPGHCHVN